MVLGQSLVDNLALVQAHNTVFHEDSVETQHALAILVELRGSNIHGNLDLIGIASLSNRIGDEVKALLGGLNVKDDTTLVTDLTSRLSALLLGKGLEDV
jgi:hypothetical protein